MSDDRAAHRRSPPSPEGLERLGAALGVDASLHVVRRLGGGLGAATHLLAAGQAHFVLKRYPEGRDAVPAEWDALVVAHNAGLPVPAPIAADQDGVWFGSPALVMSMVPGGFDLSPGDIDTYVNDISAVLAQVHAVPADSATHLRAHEPSTWAIDEPIADGLLPASIVREIREAVASLPEIAADEVQVFGHGDCHPANLLWDQGRLSGLVDWSQACTTVRWWELAYMRVELALLTDWDVATELLSRYEGRTGLRSADQPLWDLFHVLIGHRWAHTWLEGWCEQGRADLDLDDVARRLEDLARMLLVSL